MSGNGGDNLFQPLVDNGCLCIVQVHQLAEIMKHFTRVVRHDRESLKKPALDTIGQRTEGTHIQCCSIYFLYLGFSTEGDSQLYPLLYQWFR